MRYISALVLLVSLGVHADAATSREDQTKIQASLSAQGYSKWKRIELDNGVWEVTDAVDASHKKFDLRVEAASLKVTSKILCGPAD